MSYLRDWADGSGGTCLTKALLDCAAGTPGGGFELYCRYMEEANLVDSNVSFSGLSRFGRVDKKIIANLQYHLTDRSKEPAQWTIFSKNDVARLGNLLSLQFVIYVYTPTDGEVVPSVVAKSWWLRKILGAEGQAKARFTICHDTRAGEVSDREENLFGVVISGKAPYRLFRLPNDQIAPLDSKTFLWFAVTPGPAQDVGLDVEDFDGDFLQAVDGLLNLTKPEDFEDEIGRRTSCRQLKEIILCNRNELFKRWGRSVMLVSFVRQLGKAFLRGSRRRASPKQTLFTCLAIAAEPDQLDQQSISTVDFADHATMETIVVCLFARRYLVLVSEPFRIQNLIYHLDTRGLADKLMNSGDLSGVPRRLPKEVVEEARQRKKERAGSGKRRKMIKKCKCSICKSATSYAANMADAGPERLCSVPYTLKDLLLMLSAFDEASQASVARMVELSVAAMDIESQTVELDFASPRPGPKVVYEEFGGPVLQGHLLKTQRPIMIGHTDTLSRERGERWFDRTKDDSPKAVFDMMARYWLKVCELKKRSLEAKNVLATELLALVDKYRQVFFAFSNNWLEASQLQRNYLLQTERARIDRLLASSGVSAEQHREMIEEAEDTFLHSDDWRMAENKSLIGAFRSSIPGLLEERVRKLCRRYVIFNFYG